MGEEALAILGQVRCSGKMALLDESPRSADAQVHNTCRVLAIPKDGFDDLLFLHKDLAYEVYGPSCGCWWGACVKPPAS
ncbi:MAG: cyclic nucleotide-binding domain-containing protein [Polyangiaceae bacterium]